jgi:hypothetical protein
MERRRRSGLARSKYGAIEAESAAAKAERELEERIVSEELRTSRERSALRRLYAPRILCLAWTWLIAVYLLVVASALPCCEFTVPTGVLVAALGTTAVHVIGLLLVVAEYAFPRQKQ